MRGDRRSPEPLTITQLEKVMEAASRLSYRHRLIAHVVPYSGLTLSEFAHLRRSGWIVYSDRNDPDSIFIHVPEKSPCIGTTRYEPHSGQGIETRQEPCYLCQPEGVWTPETSSRVRSIRVDEDATIETMTSWFERYDSFPFTSSESPYKLMDDLKDEAGLSRNFGFTALRRTYAYLLITKGFKSETVVELLGMDMKNRVTLRPIFEAAGRPVDWDEIPASVSRKDLLEDLQQLGDELGYPPTLAEVDEQACYSPESYRRTFGGHTAALEAAGFSKPKGKIRREELLRELRRLADELGHRPTITEVAEQGKYSYKPYRVRFGGLWNALEEAGFDTPEVNPAENVSQEELIEELRRLADEQGHLPTTDDIRERCKYSYMTYYRRFGGLGDALEAAEFDSPEGKIRTGQLLTALRRLASELGHLPKKTEIEEQGEYSYTTYYHRFGGIESAHEAAGIAENSWEANP